MVATWHIVAHGVGEGVITQKGPSDDSWNCDSALFQDRQYLHWGPGGLVILRPIEQPKPVLRSYVSYPRFSVCNRTTYCIFRGKKVLGGIV